jgi:hypothetical protein
LTNHEEEAFKYAPIAGGLDLYLKGIISGMSLDPVYPNYCISEYPNIYEFSLLFNEFLDFYSSTDANSFKVFDKIIEMYGLANLVDLNCHFKDWE